MVDLGSQLASARAAAEAAALRYTELSDQLAQAEVELKAARDRVARIEKALAILNGEDEPAPAKKADPAPEQPAPSPPPRRKPEPVGPYAHVTCSGCGTKGQLYETMRSTKNGTVVRLLVCGTCKNETYIG